MKLVFMRLQWLLLTAYIVSVIIFKMHYFAASHILGLLMVFNFFLLMFIDNSRKFIFNSVIYYYFFFVLLALLGSLWSINPDTTSYRAIQISVLLLYMFVIYNSMKNFNMQNTFLNAILIGSLVNYLLLLGIIPAPFPIVTEWGNRAFGTVGNPNVLSFVMLISILVSSIYIGKRESISNAFYYYQYLNMLLALYVILLTASKKGAIFGALLFLIFLIQTVKDPKMFFKFLLGALLGLLILSNFINMDNIIGAFENTMRRFMSFESQMASESTSGSTGERKYFIQIGLEFFQNNPIWGHGLDTFRFLNPMGVYAHNNYIEVLVGMGIVGFGLFYAIYATLIKKMFEMDNKQMRNFFLAFTFILLFMEMAFVSYGLKLVLITLVALSVFIEQSHTNVYEDKK